jgi:hypothetical protein
MFVYAANLNWHCKVILCVFLLNRVIFVNFVNLSKVIVKRDFFEIKQNINLATS